MIDESVGSTTAIEMIKENIMTSQTAESKVKIMPHQGVAPRPPPENRTVDIKDIMFKPGESIIHDGFICSF
jgi:hypothetical protein